MGSRSSHFEYYNHYSMDCDVTIYLSNKKHSEHRPFVKFINMDEISKTTIMNASILSSKESFEEMKRDLCKFLSDLVINNVVINGDKTYERISNNHMLVDGKFRINIKKLITFIESMEYGS